MRLTQGWTTWTALGRYTLFGFVDGQLNTSIPLTRTPGDRTGNQVLIDAAPVALSTKKRGRSMLQSEQFARVSCTRIDVEARS